MTFCVHIALDRFGAESIARALSLTRGSATHASERHMCVWAGLGPAPTSQDVWDPSLPRWDEAVRWPEEVGDGTRSLADERQSVALGARSFLLSPAGAAILDQLLREVPVVQRGLQLTADPVVVLVGSLAVPSTSGLLLGLIAGLSRLRYLGRFGHRVFVVAGTGVAGTPATPEPERTRVLIAQALMDLQHFGAAASATRDRAVPILLVGEQGDSEVPTDRATQVSVAGITLVALTRSQVDGAGSGPPQGVDPFLFEVDSGGLVSLGGLPWEPARPLSVVGGYAVSCPSETLAGLIAARACKEALALLADQEVLTSLEAAERSAPLPPLGSLLADLEAIVAGYVWSDASGAGHGNVTAAGDERPTGVPDVAAIDRIFGDVFEGREWQHVLANYGGERLRALPLDDWAGAVEDLIAVVEQGLLVRRRQQLVERTRGTTLKLLRGLDAAVGEVFRRAFAEPVGYAPHRTAQMLIGRIFRAVSARREQIQQADLLRPSGPSQDQLKQNAANALRRFQNLLAAVPSPVAVLLRALPITGIAVALAQLVPFDLGAADAPLARLAVGLSTGAVLSLGLFLHQVDLVRRRLFVEFGRWLSDYRTLLEMQDSELREASRYQLLDAAEALLRWYYNGTTTEPPLPEGLHVQLGHDDAAKVASSSDCRSRQSILSGTTGYLSEAAARFDALGRKLLLDYQPSAAETRLPEITAERTTDLDREYSLVLGPAGLDGLLASARSWCEQNVAGPVPWFLPFDDAGAPDASPDCPAWRRSLWMPGGTELLEVETQRQSSAYRFFCSIRSYVGTQVEDRSHVTQRVSDYEREHRPAALQSTALGERFLNRSSPSMPVSIESIAPVVLGAGPHDRLALAAGQSNGRGTQHLSAYLQVRHHLAAEDLISFPNAGQPVTALGKAWRAHQMNPLSGGAFAPVLMPGDDVA